jgi:Xaa-Pro aminopeptidase
MSVFSARAEQLAEVVQQRELDALLVTNLVNVRYLTGFSGTSGACLVRPGRRVFLTDFRYVERASRQMSEWEVMRGRDDLLQSLAELLGEWDAHSVGFEDWHMTVRAHAKLAGHLPQGTELVPASGLVEELRAVKDPGEVSAIRGAAEIADAVYRWVVCDFGLAGHTERELALAMEARAKQEGAEGLSFPAIVAAADNGALPHAEPRPDVPIPRGTLVVIDFGCLAGGYCSDCTRTFATGELDADAREVYELVRSAQAAALEAVHPGADVRAVDAVARDLIKAVGRGEEFGHGLGHGVGLEIHEAPRLAPSAEGVLAAGNIVTVEPGVYVAGRFGVRIEDLVVVSEDGPQVLTSIPKDLTVVE